MGTKPQKREITALEYEACRVMAELTRIFARHCPWWKIYGGLNLEVTDRRLTTNGDVLVIVRPAGWGKDDYIKIRFSNNGPHGWKPFEGTVRTDQKLPHANVSQFHFKLGGTFDRLTIKSDGGSYEQAFLDSLEASKPTTNSG